MVRESRMDELIAKSDCHDFQNMLSSCDIYILIMCKNSNKLIAKVIKWKGSYFKF